MDIRRFAAACAGAVAVGLVASGAGGAPSAPAASSPPPFVVAFTPQTPEGSGAPLRVMRADGSEIRTLTSGADFDVPGAWSPDGSRIAFERVDASRIYSSVGFVGLDGARETVVDGGYAERPSWSPDGAWLAYQEQTDYGSMGARADTSFELYAVRPDGAPSRDLGSGGTDGSSADWVGSGGGWDWSPDSKRIAVVQPDPARVDPESGEAASRLVVVDVESGRVLGRAGPLWDPEALVGWTWSPDGRRIALVVPSPSRGLELLLLDPATAATRPAAENLPTRGVRQQGFGAPLAEAAVGWDWSPDGRRLAVVQPDPQRRDESGRPLLHLDVVDAITGRAWHLPGSLPTRNVGGSSLATAGAGWSWSPDGRRIAFLRARPAKPPELVVADVVGRRVRVAGPATAAVWSPDGRRLAVTIARPSPQCGRVWMVAAESGTRRALVPRTVTCDENVDWWADGSFLVFERAKRPFTVERDGSGLQELATAPATAVLWPDDCSQAGWYRGDWVLRDDAGVPRLVNRPPLPKDAFAAWRC
jgi:Tol biopolymer transport system component